MNRMNREFTDGYQSGLEASDRIRDRLSEDEIREHLANTVEFGMIKCAGYWSGRLTTYGSDPTLDDGTMLSY